MGYDTREREMCHSASDAYPTGDCDETLVATSESAGDVTTRFAADSLRPGSSVKEASDQLPYWLVNIPRSQWPSECPDYLRDLPAKSIRILSTPDAIYERQSWQTVKQIISECSRCGVTAASFGMRYAVIPPAMMLISGLFTQDRIESTSSSASRPI